MPWWHCALEVFCLHKWCRRFTEMQKNIQSVYVETSVVSNLTARPSNNMRDMAHQLSTGLWWNECRHDFALYASPVVEREALRGNSEAASRRMAVLAELKMLVVTPEAVALAEQLLAATAVPRKSYDDAMHVSIAAVSGMDFLLTWNCRHIANAITMPKIYETCAKSGYKCPLICTPEQMKGE